MKGNKAKGKGKEVRDISLTLDNIKAQIIKHYQQISDREAFATAEMVCNAYQGIGSEYETLIKAFDKDCANFLKRVGKDRTIGTYKVMVSTELCCRLYKGILQKKRYVHAGTHTGFHQGVRSLPYNRTQLEEPHDMAQLHVAERRGDESAL